MASDGGDSRRTRGPRRPLLARRPRRKNCATCAKEVCEKESSSPSLGESSHAVKKKARDERSGARAPPSILGRGDAACGSRGRPRPRVASPKKKSRGLERRGGVSSEKPFSATRGGEKNAPPSERRVLLPPTRLPPGRGKKYGRGAATGAARSRAAPARRSMSEVPPPMEVSLRSTRGGPDDAQPPRAPARKKCSRRDAQNAAAPRKNQIASPSGENTPPPFSGGALAPLGLSLLRRTARAFVRAREISLRRGTDGSRFVGARTRTSSPPQRLRRRRLALALGLEPLLRARVPPPALYPHPGALRLGLV